MFAPHLTRIARPAIVLAAVLLLAAAAVAQEGPPRRAVPRIRSAEAGDPRLGPTMKEMTRRYRASAHGAAAGPRKSEPRAVSASPEAILLSEGFEDTAFPPTGWTSVVAAGSPDWVRSTESPHDGAGAAYSEFGPSGPLSKKYLVTKRLALNASLIYKVTFWLRRGFDLPFDPDTLYVRLATADSLVPSFTTLLYRCSTGPDTSTSPDIYTTTYKQFTASFTGIGGTAWIAFDHEDTDGQSLDLDDVQVEEIVNNDIAAASVDDPAPSARKNLGGVVTPKASFHNYGVLTQTNIPVRFRIINGLGSIVYNGVQTIASLAPNATTQVSFPNFTPSVAGNYTARAVVVNPGDLNTVNDSLAASFRVPENISGTVTVGPGGMLTTLADAVHYLGDNNVAGALTFSLTGTTYTEPPLAIDALHYATSEQPVLFRPAPGVSATVTVSATPAAPYGIRLKGVHGLTIDGSNNGTTTQNLTLSLDTTGFYATAFLVTGGCRGVTLANATVKGYRKTDGSANVAVAIDTTLDGARDSAIVFRHLNILRAFNAFSLLGPGARSANVRVERCVTGGSGIDAIAQAGIVAYNIDSLTVAECDLKDIARSAGIIDLFGIYLGEGCRNTTVRANRIHAIRNDANGYYAHGIVDRGGAGSNLLCYNNALYDIVARGSGPTTNLTVGLGSLNAENTGERFYYNSVSLAGVDSSSSSFSISAGIMVEDGASALQVRNNIVANGMTFAGAFPGNKAYCVYLGATAWPSGSTSARNDLLATGPHGVTGYVNGTNRASLADWQAATSQDAGSIAADPVFLGPADLHVQTIGVASPVNGQALPVAGITTDLDGEARDGLTPDIGADEFSPQLGAAAPVLAGWNLVSLPVVPADARRTVLFPAASSNAYAFEGAYVTKDTLVSGPGYWLKFPAAQTVEIVGAPVTRDTIPVAEGWNLVGSVAQPVAVVSITSLPPGIVTSQFFAYTLGYAPADTIKPMRGYWVKTTAAGALIVATGGGAREGTIRIVPTDELPPPPPPAAADETPRTFGLEQNYPNPFNPSTVIRYHVAVPSRVTLTVYSLLGQEVARLVDAPLGAGSYEAHWSSASGSGIYFCRVVAVPLDGTTPAFTRTMKMALLR